MQVIKKKRTQPRELSKTKKQKIPQKKTSYSLIQNPVRRPLDGNPHFSSCCTVNSLFTCNFPWTNFNKNLINQNRNLTQAHVHTVDTSSKLMQPQIIILLTAPQQHHWVMIKQHKILTFSISFILFNFLFDCLNFIHKILCEDQDWNLALWIRNRRTRSVQIAVPPRNRGLNRRFQIRFCRDFVLPPKLGQHPHGLHHLSFFPFFFSSFYFNCFSFVLFNSPKLILIITQNQKIRNH